MHDRWTLTLALCAGVSRAEALQKLQALADAPGANAPRQTDQPNRLSA